MHISVMKEEVINYLNLKDDSIVVDMTLGYAGHSSEILSKIPNGHLYAFDQDIEAINSAEMKLKQIANNYTIIKSNFLFAKEKLEELHVLKVDAILYDLGVSSPQLDEDKRGFSFHKEALLDMRMDKENKKNAYDIVNTYSKDELNHIFKTYGEEKYASSIASAIVKKRLEKKITTTLELVDIIKMAVPEKYKRLHHPARKIFQALRIEVNDELNVFDVSLRNSLTMLKPHGRLCVITFHSLEDRICKKIFADASKVDNNLSQLPIIPDNYQPKYQLVASITPSKEELAYNNRSRSARLRVIERGEQND